VRLDHLLSREPTASAVHIPPILSSSGLLATHDSGVKAPLVHRLAARPPVVSQMYLSKCSAWRVPRRRVPLGARAAVVMTSVAWHHRPAHVGGQGRQYAHMVDASARRADEGRGRAAISVGESRADCEPTISEWGNPAASAATPVIGEGTGGTEPSHVPRGRESIPVVVASEPGTAQTVVVPSRQALRRRGCRTDHGVLPRAR
jgi:hypothetical protein